MSTNIKNPKVLNTAPAVKDQMLADYKNKASRTVFKEKYLNLHKLLFVTREWSGRPLAMSYTRTLTPARAQACPGTKHSPNIHRALKYYFNINIITLH